MLCPTDECTGIGFLSGHLRKRRLFIGAQLGSDPHFALGLSRAYFVKLERETRGVRVHRH